MSEAPASGPVPSKHVFLHELASLPGGSKVRFMGCVLDYDVSTASLLLEHCFPQSATPIPTASVNVRLVLESTKPDDLQSGSWLNVIGYVRKPAQRRKKAHSSTNEAKVAGVPVVQAILVWGTAAINVTEYEAALVSQRELKDAVDFHAGTRSQTG